VGQNVKPKILFWKHSFYNEVFVLLCDGISGKCIIYVYVSLSPTLSSSLILYVPSVFVGDAAAEGEWNVGGAQSGQGGEEVGEPRGPGVQERHPHPAGESRSHGHLLL